MRKLALLISTLVISITFTACTSFKDEYKPMYQAQPEVKTIERTK